MKQQHFETRYGPEWTALDVYLQTLERGRKGGRKRSQTPLAPPAPAAVENFPAAYRRLCAQLALARQRQYSSRLVDRLGDLALRGHQQLYRAEAGRLAAVMTFLSADFPRLVRAQAGLFWLCAALFYGPLLLLGVAVYQAPELIFSLLDHDTVGGLESMYDPAGAEIGSRPVDSDVAMFGFYIYNNIGIGFRTFAGGLLFGVGSLLILIYNGVFIGAVAGYITSLGYGATFFPFVIAHGAFELTAVVLAGVAGMRLGLALLIPGRYGRLQALKNAAKLSVKLIYGVFALLLLAAFVEAFWSSQHLQPARLRYAVGAACWLLVIAYLVLAGRRAA